MSRLRSLRRQLVRMERDSGGRVLIPQVDGTIARFSEKEALDGFARSLAILRARAKGEEPPPLHPTMEAVKNAAIPEPWHGSYRFDECKIVRRDGSVMELGEVEDLSEP